MSATAGDVSTYRWSRAALLRLMGIAAFAMGGGWVAIGVLSAWRGMSPLVGGIGAGLTAVVLLAACWFFVRPPRVLELTEDGYRVHHLRGGGVAAARWAEVQSVDARSSAAGAVLVVDLADGRSSVVPVSLLGSRAEEAQRDMHGRLNRAYGYRSLRDAAG
ncbi:MAG: hypothetical protein H0V07_04440 [Propionibacteriales bacterium]|nr:hypothetical protein [Propionibacteriales bacterium]